MNALDAVLRLLSPGIVPEAIPPLAHRPEPHWAKPREVSRIVIDVLREAARPMTTHEVASVVAAHRGVPDDGTERKHVYKSLRRMRERGMVVSVVTSGVSASWRVPPRF